MQTGAESETSSLIGSDAVKGIRLSYASISPHDVQQRTSTLIAPSLHHSVPLDSTEPSSTITFHDISYQIITKAQCSCKSTPKRILRDVHGIFKPGMNAVMGPTGSGKTSLLDILASRKDPRGLSGTILMDGRPLPENFRLMVGYVAQDDKVTGTLTIRENLAFSAALRLPKSVTKEERRQRVEQVLFELGLTEAADTKVGDEFVRGVSGGERKRCNIGMELIISPVLLFLDEPTTGLDASTANAVMMQLRRLSMKGRNIIFSIHQPRSSIFRQFDSLMLLSRGSVVFHGPSQGAVDYFETIGYVCDRFNNPADFFLDVINGDSTAVTSYEEYTQTETHDDLDPAHLNQRYLASPLWNQLDHELRPIIEDHLKLMTYEVAATSESIYYKTNFFSQLMTVSGRSLKNLHRNPRIFYSQLSVILVFGLLVGAIYYQVGDSRSSAIQNRTGAFFLIIMNQVFGNMSAVELFIHERAIFIHENLGGFYRVSAFFLAKVFCDVLPMRIIPAILFSAVAYYMIGLRGGIDHFAIFALTGFVTGTSSAALAFFFSSTVKVYGIATLCLSLCYVFMMIFSGYLINIGDLGTWISWVKYLSIFRYSLNVLNINELKDRTFCGNATGVAFNLGLLNEDTFRDDQPCTYGNTYLAQQHIAYRSQWDLWWNVIALGLFTVAFLFLAYVQLRRLKKLK